MERARRWGDSGGGRGSSGGREGCNDFLGPLEWHNRSINAGSQHTRRRPSFIHSSSHFVIHSPTASSHNTSRLTRRAEVSALNTAENLLHFSVYVCGSFLLPSTRGGEKKKEGRGEKNGWAVLLCLLPWELLLWRGWTHKSRRSKKKKKRKKKKKK